jgi:hypothetical protein
MAWDHINLIYGVVMTIAEIQAMFPDYDWPSGGDGDDDPIGYVARDALVELLVGCTDYTYSYQSNRCNRWTGETPVGVQRISNEWVHGYNCCSDLLNTHVILGRVVGDVEPEQFLDLPPTSSLPIWDSQLTFEALSQLPGVNIRPTDYIPNTEVEGEVRTFLSANGIQKSSNLYVMADDCYSCT